MFKKPLSEAQLDANRRNAQLSTGPRTAEGKAASSMNAFTHGLTALTAPILTRDRARFKEFSARLVEHYQATDPLEKDLVDRIILARWHMGVAERMLAGFVDIAECPDLPEPKRVTERYRNRRLAAAMMKDAGQNAFAKILRYQESAQRNATRAQKILLDYQSPPPPKRHVEPRDETKPNPARPGALTNPLQIKEYDAILRKANRGAKRIPPPPIPLNPDAENDSTRRL